MKKLAKEDLDWCVKRLPKRVKSALKAYSCNLSLGGGYIRSCIANDELKDIDLFVNSIETAKEVDKYIRKEDQKIFHTQNAYTILRGEKPPVQVIHRWLYAKPEDVLKDLDFTICCAVIWYENGKFHSAIDDNYYPDLAAKRLRYTSPNRIEESGGSLIRVLKYYNKGYRIMLTSLAKVVARACSKVEQIGKVISEADHARILNGLLLEVDPNAIGEVDIIRDTDEKEEEENNIEE